MHFWGSQRIFYKNCQSCPENEGFWIHIEEEFVVKHGGDGSGHDYQQGKEKFQRQGSAPHDLSEYGMCAPDNKDDQQGEAQKTGGNENAQVTTVSVVDIPCFVEVWLVPPDDPADIELRMDLLEKLL